MAISKSSGMTLTTGTTKFTVYSKNINLVKSSNWSKIKAIDFGNANVKFNGTFSGTNTIASAITSVNILSAGTQSCLNMFKQCTALTRASISIVHSKPDTYCNAMFYRDSKLCNFSGNLNSVLNTKEMFAGCDLSSCTISNLDNVTNTEQMFYSNKNLSGFSCDLKSVTSVTNMFWYCSALSYCNVGSLSKCVSLVGMFTEGAKNMKSFSASPIVAKDTSYMFNGNISLTNIQLGTMSALTNSMYMFNKCYSLSSVSDSNFLASGVTNARDMFYCCSSLTSVQSVLNIPNCTNIDSMFNGCTKLKSIGSTCNLSSVTSCKQTFLNCSSLTGVSFGAFNKINGENMYQFAMGCSSLRYFDSLSYNVFQASGITSGSIKQSFYNCSSFNGSVYFGWGTGTNYDTNLYNIDDAFYNCQSIRTIVGATISSITSISTGTFYNCKALKKLAFSGLNCSLDLRWCSNLEAYYLRDLMVRSLTQPSGSSATLTIAKTAYNTYTAVTGGDYPAILNLFSADTGKNFKLSVDNNY